MEPNRLAVGCMHLAGAAASQSWCTGRGAAQAHMSTLLTVLLHALDAASPGAPQVRRQSCVAPSLEQARVPFSDLAYGVMML